MKLIGFTGKAGSGKDAASDVLVRNHYFTKVAFADVLKRACKEFFEFSDAQLWGSSDLRNEPDKRYRRKDGTYLSPRTALQLLGTEFGRECYPDIWIEYTLRIANTLLTGGEHEENHYRAQTGLTYRHGRRPKGVVISDVRFKNEIDAIHKAGGIIVRMLRGTGLAGAAGKHVSETEQQSLPESCFDLTLDNREWSLEQLEVHVNRLPQMYFEK